MEGTAKEYDRVQPKLFPLLVASSLDTHFSTISWSDDDVVLDIGCGPGRTTRDVLLPSCPRVKRIVAVDIVPEYIEYARKNYPHEKIEYKLQNIVEKLETSDIAKYDKIVSFYALHFIADFDNLRTSIFRLLKPGGYFLFLILPKNAPFSVMRDLCASEDYREHIKKEDVLAEFSPMFEWEEVEETFENALCMSGMEVTSCRCDKVDVPCLSKEYLMDLCFAVIPKAVSKDINPKVKDQIWKHWMELLLPHEDVKVNCDPVILSLRILQVFGCKKV